MMVSRRRKLVKFLVLNHVLAKTKQRLWVHPMNKKRDKDGEHVKVMQMNEKYPKKFREYTRLTPAMFDKLCGLLHLDLEKQDTNFRKAVSSRIRLFVILRYLATGDNIRTIATSFSLGKTTVWEIIRLDLPVVWKTLRDAYMPKPTTEDWIKIAEGFEQQWQYPNCIGAIDGKHVVIQCPPHSGSLYRNYKGSFSIVLMATCDANYKFTTVDEGAFGKQSDGGIFSLSELGKLLNSGKLNIPIPQKPNENFEKEVPFHFVGDEAFALTLFMMRPHSARGLNSEKAYFNRRLSRARKCIENAFGILAARFQIFHRTIKADPEHAENIVLGSCILHNFIKTEEKKPSKTRNRLAPHDLLHPNAGRLLRLDSLMAAAHERQSKKMRDDLTSYFNGGGYIDFGDA